MESSTFENHEKLRELHEEEERMKLRILQADAGLIGGKELLVTAERMDWMYHNPAKAKQEENEEYLLGKALETTDEREEMRKRLGVGTTASGSLFMSSITTQNDDTLRRLREDPLLIIRQAEHRQRRLESTRQRILSAVHGPLATESVSLSANSKEKHGDTARKPRPSSPYSLSPTRISSHSYSVRGQNDRVPLGARQRRDSKYTEQQYRSRARASRSHCSRSPRSHSRSRPECSAGSRSRRYVNDRNLLSSSAARTSQVTRKPLHGERNRFSKQSHRHRNCRSRTPEDRCTGRDKYNFPECTTSNSSDRKSVV